MPAPATRGPFRPMRLTTNSAVDGDRRISLSPVDVSEIDPTVLADGTEGSKVVRRNGTTLWVRGSVYDVTEAWRNALRSEDILAPCEWRAP